MLCALLAGRHGPAALGSSSLQASVCSQLLAACQAALHNSPDSSKPLAPIVSVVEDNTIPEATINRDRLLTHGQHESLAIFKRFNISQPKLQGQVILAKVLRSSRHQVLVDSGYYGLNRISKQELASTTVYTADGQPIERNRAEILPGEYVKLRLSYYNTPYGDAQLDAVGIPADVRAKLVWSEIEQRMKTGKQIMGRILNPTVKGYAVGVAGYVALLEHGHALPETAAQIGTLQPFYVASMDKPRRQIKLSGVRRDPQDMAHSYRMSM